MTTESKLVRSLAKLVLSTNSLDHAEFSKECSDLLQELEKCDETTVTNEANPPKDVLHAVTEVIHDIGVPAHIKGYNYVREAIVLAVNYPSMLEAITKDLYPEVAKKFNTTASRVERAIRHGVEVAFTRNEYDALMKYFGGTIDPMKGKPTNSEFIACVADLIRLRMN